MQILACRSGGVWTWAIWMGVEQRPTSNEKRAGSRGAGKLEEHGGRRGMSGPDRARRGARRGQTGTHHGDREEGADLEWTSRLS